MTAITISRRVRSERHRVSASPLVRGVKAALAPRWAWAGAGLLAAGLAGLPAPAGAGPFPAEFELSSLLPENGGDGSAGFVLTGIDPDDQSGKALSAAGDINGDGIDDLIIGAERADPFGNSRAGESYIVYGREIGFPAVLDLASLDGSNGFVINGLNSLDQFGYSVSHAGDVNGDAIDDLIIGAHGAGPDGESYVVFGRDTGFPALLELATLDGTGGFVVAGVEGNGAGFSVGGAGDVNGDEIDDLIVGAPFGAPNGIYSAGQSYVVFGRDTGFPASIDLATLDGTNGFVLNGIDEYDVSGRQVSGAGDVNGDGLDDVIIGAYYADPNGIDAAGESYVVFGSAAGFPAAIDLASLDGETGFVLNGIGQGDFSGWSVSGAGDLNGDGVDDLVVGAWFADPGGRSDAGECYVVFGNTSGFPAALDLASLDGLVGFALNGVDADDAAGASVSAAGDVNDDGIDDVIVMAVGGNSRTGASYLVFGRDSGFPTSLDLATLDLTDGLVLNGIDSFDSSSGKVSGAGDVNGDGIDDVMIGAPTADPNSVNAAGETYVVFGRRPDADGDGIVDGMDNCTEIANLDQRDTNGDGFGNLCDADLDDDCNVNFLDVGLMKSVFFTSDQDADLDGDGTVDFSDLGILKESMFGLPGPSGMPNDCDGPALRISGDTAKKSARSGYPGPQARYAQMPIALSVSGVSR